MNVFDESRRKIINNALEEYGQLYDKYGDNINDENARVFNEELDKTVFKINEQMYLNYCVNI